MAARFHAEGAFKLDKNGPRALIFGAVTEGTVREGMKVAIPLNGSTRLMVEIEALELLDRRSTREGFVGLVLRPDEEGEDTWEIIQAMGIEDEHLEVTDELIL